jgi:AbrB family looped-hinge helix DNA binding protein
MTSLVMSKNGRILIPSALREQLGLEPNVKIFCDVVDGTLVLTPSIRRKQKLRDYFDKHLQTASSSGSVDEFIAQRREQARREAQE